MFGNHLKTVMNDREMAKIRLTIAKAALSIADQRIHERVFNLCIDYD